MSKQEEFQFEASQVQSQFSSQYKVMNSKSKTTRKSDIEDFRMVYLLLELEQFEKFEHWIRMGLIYLEFQNSSSKLGGLAEKLCAFPVCCKPVNFDVLVKVAITLEEHKKIQWCATNSEFGWLSPGILPINRIKGVQFSSSRDLESTSNLLKDGSVVPEVLIAYQSQFEWSLIELPDGSASEEQVISILEPESKQFPESDFRKKIYDWDRVYGQLSFLKSLTEGLPDIRLTAHVLEIFTKHLGKSWKEISKLEVEVRQDICWTPKEFFSAVDVYEEMVSYYTNKNGPEAMKVLRNHSEPLAQKLGDFIENADLRWGKVVSENQPLNSNFEVIEQLISDATVDDYFVTQAILSLSESASRLNLNLYAEPQGTARSRNFSRGEKNIYMTSLPADSMNTFLSECCFASILEECFDMKFWLSQLALSEDSVKDLTESEVIIFGIPLKRNVSSVKSASIFVKLASELRIKNKELRSEKSQLEAELSTTKEELREQKSKWDGVTRGINDLNDLVQS